MMQILLPLTVACLLVGVFSEEASIYRNGFGYSCKDKAPKCLPNKCVVDVTSQSLCTECESGYVPINGKCVPAADETVSKAGCAGSSQGGWCTKCGDDHFLFYGGCYNSSLEWTKIICERAEKGLCTKCANKGYRLTLVFTNPNTKAPERCILCGDTVGFGGYSGVYGCLFCSPPRTKQGIVATCYGCSDYEDACVYDYRCKRITEGTYTGRCIYCPNTHLWSFFACYARDTPVGASICLPKDTMEVSGQVLCSRCANPSEVPVNGLCTPVVELKGLCVKDPKEGKCTSCRDRTGGQTFLFYGGCYSLHGNSHQVGPQLCQKAQDNVCIACNSSIKEVFTKDSRCWRCGDTANGGIAGCQRCEMKGDALQCLECRDLYLSLDKKSCLAGCPRGQRGVRDPSSSVHSCTCDDGFYLKDGGCVKCAAENCAECDEARCSKCRYGYTLSDSRCAETKCKDPNCDTCESRDVCTRCAGDHSLDQNGLCVKDCLGSASYYKAIVGDVSRCVACTLDGCAVCESADRCKTCRDGFYLESQERCKPCSSACATCSGPEAGDCTSCPAKRRLQYSDDSKGSCVPQCVKDGSCAECGLTIDGTSYCSQCVKSTEYPRNGVCAPTSSRATGITCTNAFGGQCIVCGSSSFRLNGGCYTSKLLPGKTVCSGERDGWCENVTAGYGMTYNGMLLTCPKNCAVCSGGICSVCNNGFYPEKGMCNACPEGCATCPHGKACFDCLAGYYFSGSMCKACHKAVPKCSLCTVPEGATQPVCLEYGHVSRLSAGAISGITISVVLVVGAVTAILVWLLVFRKKN
ncbi:High cysteine membrane VSP-like protein [Giardia lamblia P15]|uniref:High cysteine membrane VSP-like protein n=1 Tax=Giardia intestinalis (strain P15) TaxID=658858 RepID=E1F7X8_GIAIA|nr:High cysteine membrane VSP-like protein [Giardia lamblia P15]